MSLSLPALHFPACASSSRAVFRNTSPSLQRFKGLWQLPSSHNVRSRGISHFQKTRHIVPLAANMAAGQSDGPGKLNLDRYLEVARNQWESLPQPIKSFPWTKTLTKFALIILKLTCAVTKYLFVPWFAVSSLSEMSYCAQERKMILIPVPILAGFAIAGVLKDTALELSPNVKVPISSFYFSAFSIIYILISILFTFPSGLFQEEEFPWHLLVMAVFFLLLKLPGPYYPYWLRIFIPHFANGGLWRTLWSTFVFYRGPRDSLRTDLGNTDKSDTEETEL